MTGGSKWIFIRLWLFLIILATFFIIERKPVSRKNQPSLPVPQYLPDDPLKSELPDMIRIALVSQGRQIGDFTEFISQICQKEDLVKHSFRVYIGPYLHTNLNIAFIYDDRFELFHHYIFIEEEFFNKLNFNEKKSLVAHEMGHVKDKYLPMRGTGQFFDLYLKNQMNADDFSAKYTSPDSVKNLLAKLNKYQPEYEKRITNLDK